MVDYSMWDHIEVSNDEDETHPNIDTASLFHWRHQARGQRMEQFQKEKEELDRFCHECKRKVAERQRKLKELEVAEGGKAELGRLQAKAQQLRKEDRGWEQKLEEMHKKEKSMPWNVDTLRKDGFSKSMVNTKPKKVEEDSEEKCALMEQVVPETIVMQFILELAKSLKVDPRACFRQFFTKTKTADRQYMEGFHDELEAFKEHVRVRAKLHIEKAMKEYEEEEREKRLGPGGLDPVEELQKCFDVKDVQMLQDAISKMDPTDTKYHMQRFPNSKASEAKVGMEAGPGEPRLETVPKTGDKKDVGV
uniref:Hsp90 co-chaperone Cdc37 n=1 Tax=Cercocebus atys TaxID=9531 RepID=A0A2K5NZF4_CERAT